MQKKHFGPLPSLSGRVFFSFFLLFKTQGQLNGQAFGSHSTVQVSTLGWYLHRICRWFFLLFMYVGISLPVCVGVRCGLVSLSHMLWFFLLCMYVGISLPVCVRVRQCTNQIYITCFCHIGYYDKKKKQREREGFSLSVNLEKLVLSS